MKDLPERVALFTKRIIASVTTRIGIKSELCKTPRATKGRASGVSIQLGAKPNQKYPRKVSIICLEHSMQLFACVYGQKGS